jgi:uncharacterized protein (TIGR04255 family)
MARKSEFPNLGSPPINEVACGFIFSPVENLNSLHFGIYWDKHKKEYPKTNLREALADFPSISFGVAPQRTWLISEDHSFILQLQYDRFYLNWRASANPYPHFSDTPQQKGLLSRSILEFQKFSNFVLDYLKIEIRLQKIELSKINLLESGKHWTDFADLAKLLPIVTTFDIIRRAEKPNFELKFLERDEKKIFSTNISMIEHQSPPVPAIRIESKIISILEEKYSIETVFKQANERLNKTFFSFISKKELDRFE